MSSLTIKDLLSILSQEKRLLLIVFGAVFAVTLFITFLIPPSYEVSTTILIERDDETALMLPSPATLLLGGIQTTENETELIKSRTVIDALIEKFNLQFPVEQKHDAFIFHLLRLFRGGPEFIGSPYFAKVHPGMEESEGEILVTSDGYRIENGDAEASCKWSIPCSFAGGEIVMEKIGEIPENERYTFSYRKYVKTRKAVRESCDAFPLDESKSPALFRITMETTNTPFAAALLNELVAIFASKKVAWRTESIEITRGFLEKLSSRLKAERDEKVRKLTAFMSEKRTIIPDEQVKALFIQKLELEKQKKEIDIKRSLLSEIRKTIEEGGTHMLPAPMLEEDKAISEVIAAYNTLILQEKKAAEIFFDSHPDLIFLRQQISATRQTIGTMIANTHANIQQVEAVVMEKIAEIDREMSRLPPELSEFAVLKAEGETVEKIYWFLMERLYENEIKKESMKHNTRVIDPADFREEKRFPRISLSILFALALAIIAALGAVFSTHLLRRTISSDEEVKRLTGSSYRHLSLPNESSPTGNQIDNLLIHFLFLLGLREKQKGVIVVCSPEEDSGKTFVAQRLYQILTRLGYRVSLLHSTSVEEILFPQENAVSSNWRSLQSQYDFLILDTAAMNTSSVSFVAAEKADITLMVVRPEVTLRRSFNTYFPMLTEHVLQKEHLGIIVNNAGHR